MAWPVAPNPPRAADELDEDELDEDEVLDTALTRPPLLVSAVVTDDDGLWVDAPLGSRCEFQPQLPHE